MEAIRGWILSLTAAALLTAGAEALLPKSGGVGKAGRLVCGLIMILVLLQPATARPRVDWAARLTEYRAQAGLYAAGLEETDEMLLQTIIEERSGAYIEEAAAGQGISCRVTVTCTRGEGEACPTPRSARVVGDLTEDQRRQVTVLLERELGIDNASVIWDAEEA